MLGEKPVHQGRAPPRADRHRTDGVPVRRRDLLARARARRHGARRRRRPARPLRRRRHRRAEQAHRVPPARAGAAAAASPVRIVCREDRVDRLLAALAVHDVDLVLSDTPVPPGVRVQAFSHLLGRVRRHVLRRRRRSPSKLKRRFPASLSGAPVLMAGRRHGAAPTARRLVRRARGPAANRRRVRRQRADEGVRRTRRRRVSRALRDRRRPPAPARRGSDRRGSRACASASTPSPPERRITHPAVTAIADEARAAIFAKA